MEKTKIVRVNGHWRYQIVGYETKVDPNNPAHEVEVPKYHQIYIEPYFKTVKVKDD